MGVPGTSDLGFPENNARDVFQLLTGALGPPEIRAACLVGGSATKKAVASALETAAKEPAPYYVVYFSGAASGRGIRVADGFVDGGLLGRHFEQIAAPSVLFILDVVVGAAPDADVAPAWARAMAEMRPGLRLAAGRATRIGAGAQGEGHARFTSAFLHALTTAEGDIDFAKSRFISDKQAFDEATRELEQRWGSTHLPVLSGMFGDFPLARCQARAPIGSGKILGFAVGKGVSGTVRYALDGRKGVPTVLKYALTDATDDTLGEGEVTVVADDDHHVGKVRIRLPTSLLADHTVWGPMLDMGQTVHLRFRLSLRDARGHVLQEKAFGHELHELPSRVRDP
jgi:hypothetical protein